MSFLLIINLHHAGGLCFPWRVGGACPSTTEGPNGKGRNDLRECTRRHQKDPERRLEKCKNINESRERWLENVARFTLQCGGWWETISRWCCSKWRQVAKDPQTQWCVPPCHRRGLQVELSCHCAGRGLAAVFSSRSLKCCGGRFSEYFVKCSSPFTHCVKRYNFFSV